MQTTPSENELKRLSQHWLTPDWPAPSNVRAYVTTRAGEFSMPPYDGLNFAKHVGDDVETVEKNRQALMQFFALKKTPQWINQVHGIAVLEAADNEQAPDADACFSRMSGQACTVLTADCLPVFFCNRAGTAVAVAHAGWKGLCDGMLESTVAALVEKVAAPAQELMAWIGPGIGPESFEVGGEVRQAFIAKDAKAAQAFTAKADKWLGDLYLIARQRLQNVGLASIYGGGFDTYTDPRFYSFRRDNVTGRFLSIIWME